ncbi:MAG: ABC transporter permease [Deltaproteobacteria bacterium]|nr:ABC transporter permease [Deltaproteobacteria bacterium]MBN2670112.1 ABC transporter permease [Deltaproteobacteria bacterium]
MDVLQKVGRRGIGFVSYLFMLFALLYLSIKVIWTNRDLGQRDFFKQVFLQIYFTGVQAIMPVTIVALAVGAFAIISGMGGAGLIVTGADNIGQIVTVVVIREIAPLLTGGIVIVRSATAISAELGGMRVQREIEALEAMGISPVRQLLTPRIFGGLISFGGLNVLFDAVALVCGFAISQAVVSIPAELFFKSVFSAVTPVDLVGLLIKIMVGGVGIFLIACYHGMAVGRSSTEVPVAVSRASLNALVFLLTVDLTVSFTLLLYHDADKYLGGMM